MHRPLDIKEHRLVEVYTRKAFPNAQLGTHRTKSQTASTHPLASSPAAAASWGTGVSAEAKDTLKRDNYGRTGTGACRFVPLSHETYGRAGPPAFALLHELAGLDRSSLCKDLHGECDARPFHDAMLRRRTAGPRLGAVASAPR